MGAVVSRWKAKPMTVELLEGIDKDIKDLEEFRAKNQRLEKLWVGRLLLYSSVLYLITCISVYFCYLPEQWTGRIVMTLPLFLFPILVWFMRKLLLFLFSKRTERNNDKLEDLKVEKRKILEEVMETETYKNAKLILERFDPEANKKVEMEFTPTRPGQMTPGPGQELRQRNIALRPPVMGAGTTPTGPLPRSAPGGPPGGPPDRGLSAAVAQQTMMRRPPMTPCTPIPGMGMQPPGPPLARPVLPRDRGAVDRVIEYLVGDGPQNRYALICQQCFSHNGMALKEEFEYIAFRCAYCYVLNHARKTRPQAPRLPEFSFERRMRSESPTPEKSAASEATDESVPPSGADQSEDSGPSHVATRAPTVSLATASWSSVHSFAIVHHHHKDEKELEAPSDEVEPEVEKAQSTEETPDVNVENPESAETVHTEEEPERPGEKQEVPQLETE
uniref:endoplasmic reticulum junction formation protein lunapark-B isoform X1 n=1 Tax=Oncorhynchus gorbuscha TaxID=8017 RepID=UPI001EAF4093|nr:endoplasmic reticulum junction formation protein lunapark-B isoform X1 [Oncorhynchus gorbuscha]XP_046176132.1 endoplasmic reticulum junction formation protein lunapark-B isoform X1 [Oncorhynchus gorbuscha]XP_046176133.1 endoplasmic reticulum junction formation protein lunapark-B isoform X1 [Oncorhynchus gorbuscha]